MKMNKIIVAENLRRTVALDDVDYMMDEKFFSIAERLGLEAKDYLMSMISNVQPYQIVATRADGCVIEGAFGNYYLVDFDTDTIDVAVMDSDGISRIDLTEDFDYLLIPDSSYSNNGEYLVTVFTGSSTVTFSIAGELVEGSYVKVRMGDFYVKMSREVTFVPGERISTRFVNGKLAARAGKYTSYVAKITDQLSTLIGNILNGNAIGKELAAIWSYLDVKLKELKRMKCKDSVLGFLRGCYPQLISVLGGV